MRGIRLLLAGLLAAPTGLPVAAHADTLPLPTPDAAQLASTALLRQLPNFRPDRLQPSVVPGPVRNEEVVDVGLAGDGTVARAEMDQHLTLSGVGDYAVRERGPARSATSLTDDPAPVTRRGAVVWEGFSPGSRSLGARLVLDPLIESQHLPLAVQVSFTGAHGATRALGPGGAVPGAGTVTVTIANTTEQPATLPTAQDVPATEVAGPLDLALAFARRPPSSRLPTTGAGLPSTLSVTGAAQVQASQATPFRLTGSLTLSGTTGQVTGPATTPTPNGASFAGVLGGTGGVPSVTFTAVTPGPGTLSLQLGATAVLDPRTLVPPGGFGTWKAWAASHPDAHARKAALDLLVQVAATGARASSYSPYLGADLRGTGNTSFHYAFAPAPAAVVVRSPLRPHWGAITLTVLALLLVLAGAGTAWRRL